MCFESRIIFACGCEKLKHEGTQRRLCEWSSMGGVPCSGTMIGADPSDSTEFMWECLECLTRAGSSKDSLKFKFKEARSKLSELKKRIKKNQGLLDCSWSPLDVVQGGG